jgi:hypothetical protein
MQIATVGTYALTVGWLIALVVLLLVILGLINVIPLSETVAFGLIGALAVARLT